MAVRCIMVGRVLMFVVAVAIVAFPRLAEACYPCSYWQTWWQREQVCASPSEGLLQAALDKWCVAGCALECDAWCASYTACESSGLASCAPVGATAACDSCVEQFPETQACSDDLTGCATSCSSWLGGSPVCEIVTNEELELSACACAGACADKCGASCALGYFDTTSTVTQACAQCIAKPKGCASEEGACLAN